MFHIKRNVPLWERLGRVAVGALLVGAALSGMVTGLGAVLAFAGAATLVLTGFIGYCPACALVGRAPLRRQE